VLSKSSTGKAVRCVRFADRTTSSTPRSPIFSARLIALFINLKLNARAGSGVHSPPALKYNPVRMSRKNALITIIHLPKKSSIPESARSVPRRPRGSFFRFFVSSGSPTSQKKAAPTRHYETGSGRNGHIVVIDFGRLDFSLSKADFVFHTEHESPVEIPVFLDP